MSSDRILEKQKSIRTSENERSLSFIEFEEIEKYREKVENEEMEINDIRYDFSSIIENNSGNENEKIEMNPMIKAKSMKIIRKKSEKSLREKAELMRANYLSEVLGETEKIEDDEEDDEEDEEDEQEIADEIERQRIQKEIEDNDPLSPAQKRLQGLNARLDDVSRGYHPRRTEAMSTGAFFSMMFSDDIVFQPFPPLPIFKDENDEENKNKDENKIEIDDSKNRYKRESLIKNIIPENIPAEPSVEYRDASDSSDITNAITERKILLEKERLQQLYKTSLTEIPSENWTQIIRKEEVHWEKFMETEERKRESELIKEINGNLEKDDSIVGHEFFKNRLKIALNNTENSSDLLKSEKYENNYEYNVNDNYESSSQNSSNNENVDYNKSNNSSQNSVNSEKSKKIEIREKNEIRENALQGSVFDLHATGPKTGIKFDPLRIVPKPTPLPFGRVLSGVCEINLPQYYYVSTSASIFVFFFC